MMHIVFLPAAEQEMIEAALYYQSQATKLGDIFICEVEKAIKSIIESPNMWPILEGKLRRRLLKRFPFGVLYKIETEAIFFIAIAHLKRKPGYRKDR